ncbi:MAG TPA: cytochrome C oxidase subunit IV family protein [Mycobacteriales bacterium]|nr:cytochrome C oxidase subunit IV family protein [Mycobacteriales bacterium]
MTVRRLNRRLLAVWAVLSAITVIYIWIDHSADHHGTAHASSAVTVIALLLAAVKVRIIMREFMEVRNAPILLCRLTDAWIAGMSAAMIGFYLAGRAVAT